MLCACGCVRHKAAFVAAVVVDDSFIKLRQEREPVTRRPRAPVLERHNSVRCTIYRRRAAPGASPSAALLYIYAYSLILARVYIHKHTRVQRVLQQHVGKRYIYVCSIDEIYRREK